MPNPGETTRRSFAQAARAIEERYRRAGQSIPSGMRIIGEEIKTDVEASRPGAGIPRDSGTLAGTLRVDGPEGPRHEVTISAGGAAAPYALRQHEELTWKHPLGEARYLVRGVDRWVSQGRSVRAALNEMFKFLRERRGA